jgi:hypothetical protein
MTLGGNEPTDLSRLPFAEDVHQVGARLEGRDRRKVGGSCVPESRAGAYFKNSRFGREVPGQFFS